MKIRDDNRTKIINQLLNSSNWKKHLAPLLANEEVIRSIDPATASDSQKEDWSQILFTKEYLLVIAVTSSTSAGSITHIRLVFIGT